MWDIQGRIDEYEGIRDRMLGSEDERKAAETAERQGARKTEGKPAESVTDLTESAQKPAESVQTEQRASAAVGGVKAKSRPYTDYKDALREFADSPDILEALTDTEPRDIGEMAASMLGSGGIKLLWNDEGTGEHRRKGFKSHSGYEDAERKGYFNIFAPRAKGGLSLGEAGEQVELACREADIPYDEGDAMAGVNALLGVMQDVRLRGELTHYIEDRRVEQARRMEESRAAQEAEWAAAYEAEESAREQELRELSAAITDKEYHSLFATDEDITRTKNNENGETEFRGNESDTGVLQGASSGDAQGAGTGEGGQGFRQGFDGEVHIGEEAEVSGGSPRAGSGRGEVANGGFDSQGNPIDGQGRLIAEKVNSVDELTDEDFDSPIRSVELPAIPQNVDNAIGANGKPVVIKKNILERNRKRHSDLTANDSRGILKSALYTPELYGQNQKRQRPYNRVVIKVKGKNGDNKLVLLEVNGNKDNVEIAHWHYLDDKGLEKIKRQAVDEDGQLLILPSEKSEEVGALSDPINNMSSAGKDKQSPLNGSGLGEKIAKAEAETNTTPTEAQKEAGNYKKGHVQIGTFDITIENPKGSERKGTDTNGKEWSVKMQNTYGYFRGTEGVDGDHIDVFLADDIDGWNGRKVFVVDQTNTDGSFDEHKVMLGFNNMEEAENAYYANYSSDWKEKHPKNRVTAVNIEDFEKWIDSSHRKTKAFAEYASVKAEKLAFDAINDLIGGKEIKVHMATDAQKEAVMREHDAQIEDSVDAEMIGDDTKNGVLPPHAHQAQNLITKLDSKTPSAKVEINSHNEARIKLNLTDLEDKIKKEALTAEDFLNELQMSMLTYRDGKPSGYNTKNIGNDNYKLRVSNHPSNAANERKHKKNNTSVIVKLANGKFKDDPNVSMIEFEYLPDNFTQERQLDIINGVRDWINTGEFTGKLYDGEPKVSPRPKSDKQLQIRNKDKGNDLQVEDETETQLYINNEWWHKNIFAKKYKKGDYVAEIQREGIKEIGGDLYLNPINLSSEEILKYGEVAEREVGYEHMSEAELYEYLKKEIGAGKLTGTQKGIWKTVLELEKGDVPKEKVIDPKIHEKAKKYFGTTTDFNEAGYMLVDGTLLDFSGRRHGASGGNREEDHRAISDIGVDMTDFMSVGNIRMKPEAQGIEVTGTLTPKQRETLRKYIRSVDGNVIVDFDEPGSYYSEYSTEYNGANYNRVLADIDRYYEEGIKPNIQFFKSRDGKTVYGWAQDGEIYFTKEGLNPNTQLHEFTHIYDAVMQQENPKLWAKGKELMKEIPVWREVMSDPDYADIRGNEDKVASEVHSRLVGKDGADFFTKMAEEAMAEGDVAKKADKLALVSKLKKWLEEAYRWIVGKNPFKASDWSEADLKRMTLDDFNAMTLNELAKKRKMKAKESKSLVGVHNISETKLRNALKQGGLANPSAAVIDLDKGGHSGYGEISLVMPKTLVDSKTGRNAGTYTGDAWTPTYPQTEIHDINREEVSKQLSSAIGDAEIEKEITRSLGEYTRAPYNTSERMALWYLKDKGVDIPIKKHKDISKDGNVFEKAVADVAKRNPDTSFDSLQEDDKQSLVDAYIENHNQKPLGENERANRIDEMEKSIEGKSELAKKNVRRRIEQVRKYGVVLSDINTEYNMAISASRRSGETDVEGTTKSAIDYMRENNLSSEYQQWLGDKIESLGGKEVLFKGFKPDGTRVYMPNTAQNASIIMNSEKDTNSYDNSGLSATKASLLKKVETLSQIRKNKGLLGTDVKNEAADKELSDELLGLIKELADMEEISNNQFMNIDYAEARLQEAFTNKNPVKYLEKEYGYKFEDGSDYGERIAAFVEKVKNTPVKYFETKFKRPVLIDEFTSAVVPDNASEDIVNALKDNGLNIVTYKHGDDVDRKRALDEASTEDARFMFAGEKGAANLDKSEEATTRLNNLKVAREMETAKKDAKAIKLATGWERGKDGKWRYEIEDFNVDIRGTADVERQLNKQPWAKELQELGDKVFNGASLHERGVLEPSAGYGIQGKEAELRKEKGSSDGVPDAADIAVRDAIVEVMRNSGMDVVTDEREGQRVLELAEIQNDAPVAETSLGTWTANEDASSSARGQLQGSKIKYEIGTSNDFNTLKQRITDDGQLGGHEFLYEIAKLFGFKGGNFDHSYYSDLGNGNDLRIADHYGNADNYNRNGNVANVHKGFVIKLSPARFKSEENVKYKEFVYFPDLLTKERQAEIVDGLKYFAESGDFNKMPRPDRINVREQRAFHGTGADFEVFDSSHMGEGEGAQSHGWGHYVAVDEATGRGYAEIAHKDYSDQLNRFYELEYEAQGRIDNLPKDIEAAKRRLESYKNELLDIDKEREETIDKYGEGSVEYSNFRFRTDDREQVVKNDIKQEEAWIKEDGLALKAEQEHIEQIRRDRDEYINSLPKRNLYTVEIPDNNWENYLVEDEPLTEEQGKRIIEQAEKDYGAEMAELISRPILKGNIFRRVYSIMASGSRLGSAKAASEFLSKAGFAGIHYYGRQDGECYVVFNGNDLKITGHVRFFKGSDGREALGYTVGGNVYIDLSKATAETAIHEYTHLWAAMLRGSNAKAWGDVVREMKVLKDAWAYVESRYPELKGDEDAMAEEVLSHYSGRRGAERIKAEQERIASDKGMGIEEKATAVSALERIKAALKRFWNGVADLLHIRFTSAEDVADRVLADLLHGVDPRKVKAERVGAMEKEKTADNLRKINDERNKDIRYMFAGERGAENLDRSYETTERMDNLGVAREMETAKKDAKTIKIATGWERGKDGKWRYEIEDFNVDIRGTADVERQLNKQPWAKELQELGDKVFNGVELTAEEEKRFDELSDKDWDFRKERADYDKKYIADYVKDAPLFDAYPKLKAVGVEIVSLPNEDFGGIYSASENKIVYNDASPISLKSVLVHEIQHAIQHIEGFASGGNEKTRYKTLSEIERLRGDVESALDKLGYTKWLEDYLMNASEAELEKIDNDKRPLKFVRLFAEKYEGANKATIEDFAERATIETEKIEKEAGGANHLYSTKSDMDYYRSLAGEVEARNAQTRMGMTAEERRSHLSEESEDVRRDEQIVSFVSRGGSEMRMPWTKKGPGRKERSAPDLGEEAKRLTAALGRMNADLMKENIKRAKQGMSMVGETAEMAEKDAKAINKVDEKYRLIQIQLTILIKYLYICNK